MRRQSHNHDWFILRCLKKLVWRFKIGMYNKFCSKSCWGHQSRPGSWIQPYFDVFKKILFRWNHEISYWNLAPFMSEAVEASRCHFFKTLMKLKCPLLMKPQGTINRKSFTMRHPVQLNYEEVAKILSWLVCSLK